MESSNPTRRQVCTNNNQSEIHEKRQFFVVVFSSSIRLKRSYLQYSLCRAWRVDLWFALRLFLSLRSPPSRRLKLLPPVLLFPSIILCSYSRIGRHAERYLHVFDRCGCGVGPPRQLLWAWVCLYAVSETEILILRSRRKLTAGVTFWLGVTRRSHKKWKLIKKKFTHFGERRPGRPLFLQ